MIPWGYVTGELLQLVVRMVVVGGGLYATFRIIDWATPVDLSDEIFQKHNIATAILVVGLWMAIAIAVS